MEAGPPRTLLYKRAQFTTQLPVDSLYSPSHAWVARQSDGLWRVGLTKFATRMLGEMVDHGFQVKPGERVEPGQIIGFLEGFKAISDLYCAAKGEFVGGNTVLSENIEVINRDPHGTGWLYAVRGEPDPQCLSVDAYRSLLDATLDRLLAKQQAQEGQ